MKHKTSKHQNVKSAKIEMNETVDMSSCTFSEEINQVCEKMFFCYVCFCSGLILNLGVEGGSSRDVTRIFDYALGLASQLKVNVSYSEVVFSWIETLIYVSTLKILISTG